ncbi:phenylacetic acid degradation protein [bacterium]|nr:MAG: phenylacetic acid degradation protein [bacterium]
MLPALLLLSPKPTDAFDDYLKKPDPAYAWKAGEESQGSREIALTSQTWQGVEWKHSILYRQPPGFVGKGTALLYITGDGPRPGDLIDLALITAAAKVPVAMLFDVPNQPLWDMKEDDLIAHTFNKYLETGDATWPLLFPMAKSAIRAMDAIQAYTKDSDNPIRQFVVTGASKRGWTTWFVGAANDKRVIGIAPMVYDNLNLAAQMPHQLKSWGKYSEQIEDYTRRGLQAKLATKEGKRLGEMVDPFTYRDRIKMPTLVVNGANDPYWAADALSLYWNKLKQPRALLTVPNAGHTLGNRLQTIETVGAFARAATTNAFFPTIDATIVREEERLKASVSPHTRPIQFELPITGASQQKSLALWVAESDTTDFREAKWTAVDRQMNAAANVAADPGRGLPERVILTTSVSYLYAPLTKGRRTAAFIEARYVGPDGKEFSVCSPTKVF